MTTATITSTAIDEMSEDDSRLPAAMKAYTATLPALTAEAARAARISKGDKGITMATTARQTIQERAAAAYKAAQEREEEAKRQAEREKQEAESREFEDRVATFFSLLGDCMGTEYVQQGHVFRVDLQANSDRRNLPAMRIDGLIFFLELADGPGIYPQGGHMPALGLLRKVGPQEAWYGSLPFRTLEELGALLAKYPEFAGQEEESN
jgi:hypothetical protein